MATYANSTTNVPLSRVLSARSFNQEKYQATKMFAITPSDKEFGKLYLFDPTRSMDRVGSLEREDGGVSVEVKADYTTKNFTCKTIAVKNKIADKYLRNSDPVIQNNHKKGMSLALARLLWKDREKTAISVLEDVNNFTNNTRTLTSTSQWSDYENSDPWLEIGDMEEDLERNTDGETVTDIFLGREVLTKLAYHPKTLALLKDTEFKTMSMQAFKAILKGQLNLDYDPNIHISRTTKNTAKQNETATNSFQAGKHFVMIHNNPDAGELYTETFGRLIVPTGLAQFTVEEFRIPGEKALYIETEMTFGFAVEQEDCGQQAKNVIA